MVGVHPLLLGHPSRTGGQENGNQVGGVIESMNQQLGLPLFVGLRIEGLERHPQKEAHLIGLTAGFVVARSENRFHNPVEKRWPTMINIAALPRVVFDVVPDNALLEDQHPYPT